MSMELEVFIPCSANLDACVTANEKSDNPCCNDIDNPKIISANSTYEFTFDWTASGVLFQILQGMPGANWETEVLLEGVGSVSNKNSQKAGIPVPVAAGPQSTKITLTSAELTPHKGEMLKAVAKLHLKVNGFMVACAFSELDMVHVSEDI